MTDRGILKTHLMWHDSRGSEVEVDVRVIYSRDKGYKGSYYQPAEPSSVEIVDIQCADKSVTVPDHFYEDEALLAECMEDWASEEADAAEWREQSRRDRLMEGF